MKALSLILAILCFSFSATETKEVTIIGQAVNYKTGEPMANFDLIISYPGSETDFLYGSTSVLCITDSLGNFSHTFTNNIGNTSFSISTVSFARIEFKGNPIPDSVKLDKLPIVSYNSEYVVTSQDSGADCTPIFGNLEGDPIPEVINYLKDHYPNLIPNPVDTVKLGHSERGSDAKCMYNYKVLSFSCTL